MSEPTCDTVKNGKNVGYDPSGSYWFYKGKYYYVHWQSEMYGHFAAAVEIEKSELPNESGLKEYLIETHLCAHLPPEIITWLNKQPNQSETIRAALANAMDAQLK